MKLVLSLGCIAALLSAVSGYAWDALGGSSFTPSILSKFDHFAKAPAPGSSIRTGGRLTKRQMGYLAEAGYASVVSVSYFGSNDTVFNGVAGDFPASDYEVEIGSSYGLDVKVFDAALTTDDLALVSEAITAAPKPVFVHCHVGWTASLFTLLHLERVGALPADGLYARAIQMGWDYQASAAAVALINAATGLTSEVQPPSLEQTLAQGENSYKSYFWPHRAVGAADTWFNQGQPLAAHVGAIKNAGYTVVLSLRATGEPTTRLAGEPSSGPVPNDEFCAADGTHDVEAEAAAFSGAGIEFFNAPVSSAAYNGTWTAETFFAVLPILQKAQASQKQRGGAVLMHCTSGYRSAAYTAALLAYEQGRCSAWALARTAEMGMDFAAPSAATPAAALAGTAAEGAEVVQFLTDVLKC